ncbi:WD40/YVTN/BNR-like repeat-containing protein [Portibacter marinus]|uniref:WD40/YVTN/BNR-like repeat-containing protein n=1 Tax=Portibacter marinus TaxID=2898660 RepID=UPI001F2CF6EC|nr:hypothetical protein [Portibacter marinus]
MVKIRIGTSKGLVTYENGIEMSCQYPGLNVTAFHNDFVAIAHKHWGAKLFRSGIPVSAPVFPQGSKTVSGQAANLRQIWHIKEGGEKYPNRLWIATEPGALFRSDDLGESWKIVEGLWNHPTRINGQHWFGAGKDLPFIHSIIVHPENNDCIYVSVSCAGIFKTMDSGLTWEIMNDGMRAEYLPNPKPVAGYDPHQVLMHPKHTNVLWQQNHCGVYRSTNGGAQWDELSKQYGFCIAIDDQEPDEAWIIPVENETSRIPTNRRLQVLRTRDSGISWEDTSNGLPKTPFYGIVLRNGLVKKGRFMAFGTTNGNVYCSDDKGKTWQCLTTNLTKVNYISF